MGTRKGKRGNKHRQVFNQSARKECAKLTSSKSTTQRAFEDRKYFEAFDLDEKFNPASGEIESNFIKDQSLTAKQHLRVFGPVPTEQMILRGKQLDKATGKMVATTDTITTKRSDRSLLRQGRPGGSLPVLKRQASKGNKRITLDSDAPLRGPREAETAPFVPDSAILPPTDE